MVRHRVVLLDEGTIGLGPLMGNMGRDLLFLPAICQLEYECPGFHPPRSQWPLLRLSLCAVLTIRASVVLELWVFSTTLTILATERHA